MMAFINGEYVELDRIVIEEQSPQPTIEDRVSDIEALVKGTPSYGELLEAVNILLGE